MPPDKGNPLTVLASQALAAATNKSSEWIDGLEKFAIDTYVLVTNGATGPDDRPIIIIEVGDDAVGTRAMEVFRANADTTNDLVSPFHHQHTMPTRYYRVTVENPGDQAITIAAHSHFVDHLG